MAQLIAIAASQAGPAHAFMTGEALRDAAEQLGHRIALNVQSSLGTQGGWSASELALTDAVIIAADMAVDRSGLPSSRIHEVTPDAVLADALQVVRAALAGAGMTASTAPTGAASHALRIVAVTSCPTGVAHTFMAAEALEQGAQALGYQIKVETQGSVGAQNTLTLDDIAAADLVLIAADTQVDRVRFSGKRRRGRGGLGHRSVDGGCTSRVSGAQRPVQTPDDRRVLHAAFCGGRRPADCAGLCAGRHLCL